MNFFTLEGVTFPVLDVALLEACNTQKNRWAQVTDDIHLPIKDYIILTLLNRL